MLPIGDELPAGIVKLAKVYIAKSVSLKLVIKWQVVTVTKVLLQKLFVRKTCRFLEDGTPVDIVLESTWCTISYEPWTDL
jgi:hypothetical protein